MNNSAPTYAAEVAQPFRDELTEINFKEMLTPADVDAAVNKQDDKVALVVLNSVCGCAARGARPASRRRCPRTCRTARKSTTP